LDQAPIEFENHFRKVPVKVDYNTIKWLIFLGNIRSYVFGLAELFKTLGLMQDIKNNSE
jgi:hypothetical protein